MQILFESKLTQCIFTFCHSTCDTFCRLREIKEVSFCKKFVKKFIRSYWLSVIKLRIVREVMSKIIIISKFILLSDILFINKVLILCLSVLFNNLNCEIFIFGSLELS